MQLKHQNGFLAELKAATYYAEQGYEIYWPAVTQSSCDFIAVREGKIDRVQVKKAYWFTKPTGTSYLQVTTRKGSGNSGYSTYTSNDCDSVCIVFEEQLWIIPVEYLEGIQNIILEKGQDIRKRGSKVYNIEEWKVR